MHRPHLRDPWGSFCVWVTAQQQDLRRRGVATDGGQPHAALVAGVCFAVALAGQCASHHGDLNQFAVAGRQLVEGDLGVFRHPYLQVGPVWLALLGAGAEVGRFAGLPLWFGAAAAAALALTAAVTGATRGRRWLALGLALGGAVAVPSSYGHSEELLVTLLLLAGSRAVSERLAVRAGVLLGLAVTVKLWAVIGLCLMLGLATRRAFALSLATAAAVGVACYAPFVLDPRFATFDYVWQVQLPAPVSAVLQDGSAFGYRERLVQVVLAATVGALLALRVRRGAPVWIAPLGLVAVRLLTDPVPIPYYWTSLTALLLVAAADLPGPRLAVALAGFGIDVVSLLLVVTAVGLVGVLQLGLLGLLALSVALACAQASRQKAVRLPAPA